MKLKIKAMVSILIGLIFLGSVVIGYLPTPHLFIELTCIANVVVGLLLIFTGIKLLRGKEIFSSIVYHMWLVTILLVCLISMSGQLNLDGAFFLLHLVNPFVFLIYYLLFIQDRKGYLKLLLAPLPAIIYLTLDYLIGSIVGQFVYGIFEVGELDFMTAGIIGVVFYLILLILSFITLQLNLLFRKRAAVILAK